MLWYRSSTIFDHELLKHKTWGWRGTQCTVNRQLELVYTVWCFSNWMLTTFLVNRGTWPRKTWVAFPLPAWVVWVSGILTKWWWQMGHKLERRLVRVMVRMPRCIRTQPFYSGSWWNISMVLSIECLDQSILYIPLYHHHHQSLFYKTNVFKRSLSLKGEKKFRRENC